MPDFAKVLGWGVLSHPRGSCKPTFTVSRSVQPARHVEEVAAGNRSNIKVATLGIMTHSWADGQLQTLSSELLKSSLRLSGLEGKGLAATEPLAVVVECGSVGP